MGAFSGGTEDRALRRIIEGPNPPRDLEIESLDLGRKFIVSSKIAERGAPNPILYQRLQVNREGGSHQWTCSYNLENLSKRLGVLPNSV